MDVRLVFGGLVTSRVFALATAAGLLVVAPIRTGAGQSVEQTASQTTIRDSAATKARARGAVIKMIRDMIDEDITPQYGEDRVARRASA